MMEWFRWYHGAVTDPKFRVVSRKSGASIADVERFQAAVWHEVGVDPRYGSRIMRRDGDGDDAAAPVRGVALGRGE